MAVGGNVPRSLCGAGLLGQHTGRAAKPGRDRPTPDSSSGTPVLQEPQAQLFLPFFALMCPAVIHAIGTGKSLCSPEFQLYFPLPWGSVGPILLCPRCCLVLAPTPAFGSHPAAWHRCCSLARRSSSFPPSCTGWGNLQATTPRGHHVRTAAGLSNLASLDLWLVPQPPNSLCHSSATQLCAREHAALAHPACDSASQKSTVGMVLGAFFIVLAATCIPALYAGFSHAARAAKLPTPPAPSC